MGWLSQIKQDIMDDANNLLNGCPREYRKIFDHLNNLHYDDQPDYALCMQVINDTIARKQYSDSIPLDWEPKPLQRSPSASTRNS